MDIKVSRKYVPYRYSTQNLRFFSPRIFSVKEGLIGIFRVKMQEWYFNDKTSLANILIDEGILKRGEQQGVYRHDEKSGRMIYTSNPKWDRSKEDIHTLDLDKLRGLPPDHRIFELFSIRSSDLNQPPEKMHEARINAVIGRFCAEEEEERVLEYIPSADTFCHLAEHFLAKGDIGKAKDCINETVKYDAHGEKVRSLMKIVDFLLENKLERESIQELREAIAVSFQVLTFGGADEGHILEEGMTQAERICLALRLALECSDSKKAFLENLSKIITFITEVRRKRMVEWPYLKAILELCEKFSLGSNLQRLLELELKNIAEGDYQKEHVPVIVDNPACPDGYPVDALIDFALPIAVPVAKKLLEPLSGDRLNILMQNFFDFRLEDESERGMWSSLFSNNISPRTAVSCALDIAILFSEDPEMVVINFESVINFIIFLASKDVLVEYYLDALLNFGKRFPQFKKELKTILDQEEKNILAPNHAVREVPVRVTCACYDHENYGKEIDGFSAQPVPLLGFLQETKVAGKLLELYEAERKRLDEIGECDINFFYEGESPGWWIESCKYWHNGSDKATVFRLAFEVACLFSENFQAIFNDISRLIHYRWGGLAHRPLMALKAIGQRFPEYRGKLSEVLKRSDVVGNRKVSVTVQLECEDITPGYTSTRNYPACTFQPIYEFEEDLKERYTREELIDFEMVREGMPKNPIEPKKCLVLDCDGVLWSGIADENGTQEIKIHREFQEQIKKLKERGIVLVLNTRNDRNIIEDVFRQHPEMPLKLEDFAVIEANWEPKSKNLLVIAGKLNLGLNSFVFLDDSAQEREMVRKGLPEVFTPGLPGNAELYVPFLMGIAEVFGNRPATEEDKRRTELYAALGKSDTLLTGASSREEGLRLLEMKAGIQIGDMSSIPRLAQVTQRTNQFNLTTHRYNEEDIRRFIQEPGSKVFSLSLADKFADHGIVGLMITRKENEDAYIIETFALSCRALGKTVEQTFMAQVVDILRKEGVKHLRGVYIPTERNGKVKDLYERFGFRKTGEEDNGTTYWELDLEKAKVEASPYITSVPFLP